MNNQINNDIMEEILKHLNMENIFALIQTNRSSSHLIKKSKIYADYNLIKQNHEFTNNPPSRIPLDYFINKTLEKNYTLAYVNDIIYFFPLCCRFLYFELLRKIICDVKRKEYVPRCFFIGQEEKNYIRLSI